MGDRIIVIFGATSRLGNVIVRALAGDFSVRAVTRDPNSTAAAEFRCLPNVEVVQGDVYDPSSLDRVLTGAWGVFVHFYVDFDDMNILLNATKMGTSLVKACQRATIEHVVYHTALSPLRTLGISAKHWDAKAEVEVLFRESGLNVTYVLVAIPFDSFLDILRPEKLSKDHYRIALPIGTTPVDFIGLHDVGEPVRQVFWNPHNFRRKTIALSAGKLTANNICSALSQHFSPIRFSDRQITHQEFLEMNFHGSRDWSHAFEFLVRTDQQYNKDTTFKLNPHTRNLSLWLRDNDKRFREVL